MNLKELEKVNTLLVKLAGLRDCSRHAEVRDVCSRAVLSLRAALEIVTAKPVATVSGAEHNPSIQ